MGYWLCGGALGASALFLFASLGTYPIALWDESRVAVNALEMYLTGPRIVTTYNFAPDLWNTKPPLLIWLMTGSLTLFGPSEWALRVPSAAAAVATLVVVMTFTWRLTRSAPTTCLACVLLVTSSGFYGGHAAATGDYDALLTLFATSYLSLLFFAVHRRKPPLRWTIAAGSLIAGAILTKGIAGLVPGVGLVLYLLCVGRWTRPFVTASYLAGAGIVLLAALAFYGLREIAGPGYLHAVVRNELSGRYLSTIGAHQQPFWYFAWLVVRSTFSAGPLLWLLPLAAAVASGRVRLGIVFSTCAAAGILLVYSASATKLPWYAAPAYPFLAVGLALSVSTVVTRAIRGTTRTSRRSTLYGEALLLVFSVSIVATAAYRFNVMSNDAPGPQGRYGQVFADLHNRGIHSVRVVEGGDGNAEGISNYAPRLRFYQLLWQTRSFSVREVAADVAQLSTRAREIVVTCDPDEVEEVRQQGQVIAAVNGCISVQP